jgi:hypothetical protein
MTATNQAGATATKAAVGAKPAATVGGIIHGTYGQPVTIIENGLKIGTIIVSPPVPVTSTDGDTFHPSAGPAFMDFHVTLTNAAPGIAQVNPLDYHVRDLSSNHITEDAFATKDPQLQVTNLQPGETVAGNIGFDAGPHGALVFAPQATALAQWVF